MIFAIDDIPPNYVTVISALCVLAGLVCQIILQSRQSAAAVLQVKQASFAAQHAATSAATAAREVKVTLETNVQEVSDKLEKTRQAVEVVHTLTNSSTGKLLEDRANMAKELSEIKGTLESLELAISTRKQLAEHDAQQVLADALIVQNKKEVSP